MSAQKRKPQIKLKDVADEAEVSVATVSLALRNHPSITPETRHRVLEAQKRLGYRAIRRRTPSPAPPRGSSRSFLYCVADFPIGKLQYAEVLTGVMRACEERSIRLELRSISSKDYRSAGLLPANIDGMILTGFVEQELVDYLLGQGVKLVVVGNYNITNVHTIEMDTFRTGESVAQRMLKDGHKTVAHLLRDPKNFNERQFLMGLRDGLEAGGVALPSERVFRIDVGSLAKTVTETARRIVNAKPRLSAVAANTLNIAEACMNEIHSLKTFDEKCAPVFYSISILSGEPKLKNCHVLDPGAARWGSLAVEKLCQIIDQPPAFPYASVVQPVGWL